MEEKRRAVTEPAEEVTSFTYPPRKRSTAAFLHVSLSVFLLFLNFFLAQYDKFVLSYFQADVLRTLNLSPSQYGILSGYATGIGYALLAIPVAFVADYTQARVWVLSIATLFWSLCVVFQGLSENFWQILLARIAMGIGQAPAEALSVSLISDLVSLRWIFVAESALYVGVYVGEAVSGQIATAFIKTNTPWTTALKAIGIVGVVMAFIIRLVLREPPRRSAIVSDRVEEVLHQGPRSKFASAKIQFTASLGHILRLHSFWLLTLSAGARQFSGNVFGYYMPSYLSSIYPSQVNLYSRYGIIVGVVGSFAVVAGGLISSYFTNRNIVMPLYLTAIGGMLSSIFVVLMVTSRDIVGGNESKGVGILYGVMSIAYLTAELWLGAFASLLVLLLPARTKTFGLAIYSCTIVLIYSSAPQIIGLALRDYDVESESYIQKTKVILAVLIPVGYWVAGVGFLIAIKKVRMDLAGDFIPPGQMSSKRKMGFGVFAAVLGSLVVALFVTSLVVR